MNAKTLSTLSAARSTFRGHVDSHSLALIVLCSASLFIGCDNGDAEPSIPISGTVSYKGKPIAGGEIRYVPADPKVGRTAYGSIGDSGNFAMSTTVSISGVVPGEYKIVVIPEQQQGAAPSGGPSSAPVEHPKDNPNLSRERKQTGVPAKYMDASTTDLRDTVDNTHTGKVNLDLKD